MGSLQERKYWSNLPSPLPGIEASSPTLQVDSLPSEPPGKPKNTGVDSLSLLQGIFLTQELNWGLLNCRQLLYPLSYLYVLGKSVCFLSLHHIGFPVCERCSPFCCDGDSYCRSSPRRIALWPVWLKGLPDTVAAGPLLGRLRSSGDWLQAWRG